MFGTRGQAFDAFKLLIAAVVAGSILVIILSMLGGFVTQGGDPVTVMAQQVQSYRGSPGAGGLSTQIVQFQPNNVISSTAIETKAGINPGTVYFCSSTNNIPDNCGGSCNDDAGTVCSYAFNNDQFTFKGNTQVTAKVKIGGKIWVYNCGGCYYIGFTSKGF